MILYDKQQFRTVIFYFNHNFFCARHSEISLQTF